MLPTISPAALYHEYEARAARAVLNYERAASAQPVERLHMDTWRRVYGWRRLRTWLAATRAQLAQSLQPVEDAGYLA
jgi:hypothetical protein